MKRFSFNYELAARAENFLYNAQLCATRDEWQAMAKCVDFARTTLQKFLAEDNLVEEHEFHDGYISANQLPAVQTIDFLRDFLKCSLVEHPNRWDTQKILRAVNFCQDLMNEPTFDSVNQLLLNESGSWSSIVWKGRKIK